MLQQRLLTVAILCATLLLAVGCSPASDEAITPQGVSYGNLQFGEEQIPINSVQSYDNEDMLLVILSPLTDPSNLTTSAIFCVKNELLGVELDVERYFCNDDYVIVYEDPQCYYAPFRRPQSGTIKMQKSGDTVSIDVDVVLFDGTPLHYKNEALPIN
jgi:hypothetical protein